MPTADVGPGAPRELGGDAGRDHGPTPEVSGKPSESGWRSVNHGVSGFATSPWIFLYDIFALGGYSGHIRLEFISMNFLFQRMRRRSSGMNARDNNRSTGVAKSCIVDLHSYRSTLYSRSQHRGRPDEGGEHVAADRRDGTEDLARTIDRLLDRVGACLAIVTRQTQADDFGGVLLSVSKSGARRGSRPADRA